MIPAYWLICGQQSCMIPLRRPRQARDHGGAVGQTEMEWEEALLMAWAERYRRTPRPIIGGRQLEPGGSRKGPRPRPRRHGCSTTLIIMMSLLPRPNDELAAKADRTGAEAEKS